MEGGLVLSRDQEDETESILDINSANLIQKFGRWLFSVHSNIVFHTYSILRVKGKENIPAYPFIICSNHQSHLDGIILSHVANKRFKYTGMIAAKDYWFDNKWKHGLASVFFNLIPIDRYSARNTYNINNTSKLVNEFLREKGKAVVILPEGSRSKSEKIRKFKKGIVVLAREARLPVLPVYIEGSGKIWPKGKWLMRPGVIKVKIGQPIEPQLLTMESGHDFIREKIVELQENE